MKKSAKEPISYLGQKPEADFISFFHKKLDSLWHIKEQIVYNGWYDFLSK